MALPCRCSVSIAEWLDSSAVGIAQIVADEVGESIFCCEGSDALFPNDFGEGVY